mmetsp:Transcript_2906/g.9833  ORF Transcript_2906/g.9833 Transcript_2906/m.9833 type:complete len:506 (-) Transcript_2906:3002-4519(-)
MAASASASSATVARGDLRCDGDDNGRCRTGCDRCRRNCPGGCDSRRSASAMLSRWWKLSPRPRPKRPPRYEATTPVPNTLPEETVPDGGSSSGDEAARPPAATGNGWLEAFGGGAALGESTWLVLAWLPHWESGLEADRLGMLGSLVRPDSSGAAVAAHRRVGEVELDLRWCDRCDMMRDGILRSTGLLNAGRPAACNGLVELSALLEECAGHSSGRHSSSAGARSGGGRQTPHGATWPLRLPALPSRLTPGLSLLVPKLARPPTVDLDEASAEEVPAASSHETEHRSPRTILRRTPPLASAPPRMALLEAWGVPTPSMERDWVATPAFKPVPSGLGRCLRALGVIGKGLPELEASTGPSERRDGSVGLSREKRRKGELGMRLGEADADESAAEPRSGDRRLRCAFGRMSPLSLKPGVEPPCPPPKKRPWRRGPGEEGALPGGAPPKTVLDERWCAGVSCHSEAVAMGAKKPAPAAASARSAPGRSAAVVSMAAEAPAPWMEGVS